MQFLDLIDEELKFQQHMLHQYQKLKRIKAQGTFFMTKKNGRYTEYYIRMPGEKRAKYVSRAEMCNVRKLQAKALGDFAVACINENIYRLKDLRDGYKPCDFFSMQEAMAEKYRMTGGDPINWAELGLTRQVPPSEDPWKREELKHSTSFGLMVRSKNEAQIAEKLYHAGLEFYYERALRLRRPDGSYTVRYPDFTIILPDGRTIYWEHAGMMKIPGYRTKHFNKIQLYFENEIYTPHNLILTYDGPKGEFHGVEISRIVENLRHLAAAERV